MNRDDLGRGTVGTYLKLYTGDGYVLCQPQEEPRVDAAVSRWIDSGRTQDTLLSLDLMDGCAYKCLASCVSEWFLSTPENRRTSIEWEQLAKQEDTEVRQSLGIWDE